MAKITFVSPVGTARWPHITQPDNTGQFADGKFKTKLVVSKKDAEPLVARLKELAKEHKVSMLPFKEDPDDPSNIVFTIKSKYKPLVVDTKKNEVTKPDLRIGGGSKLRIGGVIFPWAKGLSLQMNQVQVLELVDGQNVMFDEVEGSFDASDFADGDGDNSSFLVDDTGL